MCSGAAEISTEKEKTVSKLASIAQEVLCPENDTIPHSPQSLDGFSLEQDIVSLLKQSAHPVLSQNVSSQEVLLPAASLSPNPSLSEQEKITMVVKGSEDMLPHAHGILEYENFESGIAVQNSSPDDDVGGPRVGIVATSANIASGYPFQGPHVSMDTYCDSHYQPVSCDENVGLSLSEYLGNPPPGVDAQMSPSEMFISPDKDAFGSPILDNSFNQNSDKISANEFWDIPVINDTYSKMRLTDNHGNNSSDLSCEHSKMVSNNVQLVEVHTNVTADIEKVKTKYSVFEKPPMTEAGDAKSLSKNNNQSDSLTTNSHNLDSNPIENDLLNLVPVSKTVNNYPHNKQLSNLTNPSNLYNTEVRKSPEETIQHYDNICEHPKESIQMTTSVDKVPDEKRNNVKMVELKLCECDSDDNLDYDGLCTSLTHALNQSLGITDPKVITDTDTPNKKRNQCLDSMNSSVELQETEQLKSDKVASPIGGTGKMNTNVTNQEIRTNIKYLLAMHDSDSEDKLAEFNAFYNRSQYTDETIISPSCDHSVPSTHLSATAKEFTPTFSLDSSLEQDIGEHPMFVKPKYQSRNLIQNKNSTNRSNSTLTAFTELATSTPNNHGNKKQWSEQGISDLRHDMLYGHDTPPPLVKANLSSIAGTNMYPVHNTDQMQRKKPPRLPYNYTVRIPHPRMQHSVPRMQQSHSDERSVHVKIKRGLQLCLVILRGLPGSGKSTLAR